jgi:SAM-dependent methyltransferase
LSDVMESVSGPGITLPREAICEVCGGAMFPLYAARLGAVASADLCRCAVCDSCRVIPPFPAERVREYYQHDYFTREPWQVRKSEILAQDYWRKVRAAGFESCREGRYLEIGAGYGHFAALLGRTARTVDVVEPSEDCRRFVFEQRFPVTRILTSLEGLEGEYNGVFAFHVLEHLQSLGPFLARVANLLRPGGMFWALTPNASSAAFRRFGIDWGWSCSDQHFLFVSQSTPTTYFSRHGFRLAVARDLQPHAIHYPGWCHACLTRMERWLHGLGRSLVPARLVGRLSRVFLQNSRRSRIVLRVEQLVTRHFPSRPYDELLLGLVRE